MNSKKEFMGNNMKATPDQPAGPRLKTAPAAKSNPKLPKASTVGPPARRKTWFNSYDEEWAAFLAESSIRKSRPGISSEDPEALPRVWNIPHG
jgi:hypothetical protein